MLGTPGFIRCCPSRSSPIRAPGPTAHEVGVHHGGIEPRSSWVEGKIWKHQESPRTKYTVRQQRGSVKQGKPKPWSVHPPNHGVFLSMV